jgi:hypothetical protein
MVVVVGVSPIVESVTGNFINPPSVFASVDTERTVFPPIPIRSRAACDGTKIEGGLSSN